MTELFKHQEERYYTTTFIDNNDIKENENILNDNYHNVKNGLFRVRNSYISENQYVENYSNILSSVDKRYVMIVVEEMGNKLSVKLFTGFKRRRVGKSWFKVSKNVQYLTFNTKTGDVYSGSLRNYQNKKKFQTTIQKNSFCYLPIRVFELKVRQEFKGVDSLIDVDVINKSWIEIISKKLGLTNEENSLDQSILKSYLDVKKIKYPDNFSVFYTNKELQVPLKFIRKYDMKLVDAFMGYHGLQGQKLKKLLHTTRHINLLILRVAYNLFGPNLINQDPEILGKLLDKKDDFGFYNDFSLVGNMSEKEIKNVFLIFKDLVLEGKLGYWSFMDHIRIYFTLKSHGENGLRWRSTNKDEFSIEHLDWSDKYEFYERGEYFRTYPKKLLSLINKPIEVSGKMYYPKILTNSREYNYESHIQSNCVKTYIGRPGSIIVSISKNKVDSDVRATVEYVWRKNTQTKENYFIRKQYLGKYNEKLTEDWNEVLLKIEEELIRFTKSNNNEFVKLKKVCQNGKELFSDTVWSDLGELKWDYNKIL